MSIQAVLFDLDDTLLHHSQSAERALSRVFAASLERGQTTLEHLKSLNESIYTALFPAMLSGEHTRESARDERLRQMLEHGQTRHSQITTTLEQGKQASKHYLAFYDLERTALPGAVALIRALKKRVQVGILTNNPEKTADDEALLEIPFNHWYTAQGDGLHKPNPEFFLHALEQMGVEAENATMVGDSWEKDVLPARALGMRAVWFNPHLLEALLSDIQVLHGFEPLRNALDVILGLEDDPNEIKA